MKIRHADFYPDEFLVGVVGLGPAEIGAYWVVCALMYSRGGPIPDDDAWISRACGCNPRTWRTLKEQLITAGKLTVRGGFIINSRVIREIERAEFRLKRSRDAAEESARVRRNDRENEQDLSGGNGLGEAPAQADAPISVEPSPTNQLTNQQPDAAAERIAFDTFVAASKRHPRWPVPEGLTESRRKALRARLRDAGGIEGFLAVLAKAEASDFICSTMTGWSFSWFLRPDNFAKVREGNYDNDRNRRPNGGAAPSEHAGPVGWN